MKRFCFGSFIKVLTLCKSAVGKSQKNICGTVILSVAPSYDFRTDDGKASDLILCRSNLPQEVVESANTADKRALTDYFKANILDLIDSNKRSDVVLAIKDIITNDESIKSDTVVDKVAGLTKANLNESDTFVFESFLAGVFLYSATVASNSEGKDSIKTIDKDYMRKFVGRESEIDLVDEIDDNCTHADDFETFDDTCWQDSKNKQTVENSDNQTIHNTALVFQQFGTDNKQIVGNIETLIINNN